MIEKKFTINKLNIQDCLIISPRIYKDDRGSFHELYNKDYFDKYLKKKYNFVQDNISFSKYKVLRGIHFQLNSPQGKLITLLRGIIFDVFVDIRPKSKTFKKWSSIVLNNRNHSSLWLPPGIAHGFCVLSQTAIINYKVTNFYNPNDEYTVKWNDKKLNIKWPFNDPILSAKDKKYSISFNRALKIIQ